MLHSESGKSKAPKGWLTLNYPPKHVFYMVKTATKFTVNIGSFFVVTALTSPRQHFPLELHQHEGLQTEPGGLSVRHQSSFWLWNIKTKTGDWCNRSHWGAWSEMRCSGTSSCRTISKRVFFSDFPRSLLHVSSNAPDRFLFLKRDSIPRTSNANFLANLDKLSMLEKQAAMLVLIFKTMPTGNCAPDIFNQRVLWQLCFSAAHFLAIFIFVSCFKNLKNGLKPQSFFWWFFNFQIWFFRKRWLD